MARIPLYPFLLAAVLFLAIVALSQADSKHHKVIIHVPYKIRTIHHHTVKKIPVYHYVEHKDHHHHHHHHHEEPHHEEPHHEEPHHHFEMEEDHHDDGWD